MKNINKMMQSMLWLCVACFTMLAGCIHEDLSAYATVDTKIVSVDAQANNVTYTITANTDWVISSNEDWCTPSPDSGTGTTSINLLIDANASSEERTAIMTLTCGGTNTSIEVIQTGLVETLEVSPSQYTVDNSSQNANIAIMSNTSWSATSSTDGTDDNWLKLGQTSGSNNGFLNVSIEENSSYETREAVITIFSQKDGEESLVRTVTITQLSQGSPALMLSQTSINFSSLEQTKYVSYVSNITDVVATSDFAWCSASVVSGNIKVDVTSNTAVSSRTATVTVIGVVDGETVVTQILVSQSGVGAPEILLTSDYMSLSYLGTANGSISFAWVNNSGASVSLGNTSSWIMAAKSSSSNSITVEVEQNTSEETRVGYIELIASNSSGSQTFYYITISQSGVGAPSFIATPSSISLGSTGSVGSFFVVVDNNAVEYVDVTTSNSWLTASTVQILDGNGKEYQVFYTYDSNISDASRSGMITLEFTVGSQSYLFTVPVIQAGLGSPAVSTLENIFMQADQTVHEQSIWMMSGDNTNVTYEVVAISYSTFASGTGTTTSQEWLVDSKTEIIDDNTLHVEALENTESEVRYGEITIIATRDDSSTVLKVSVTQGAHAGAGISGLEQEIFVDWAGITDNYYFSALNNSTVTVVDTPTWVSASVLDNTNPNDGTGNSAGDDEGSYDKILNYTVEPYYGGETGSFREGTITLKADNGNANAIYYDVKICQYEPSAAMAAVEQNIYLTYDAQTVTPVIDLMNNAKIVNVTSSASWLTIDQTISDLSYENGVETFTYSVSQFDGSTDETRVAYITVKVQNNNANTMTYTITVTQGDPMEAYADVPEEIYVGYQANSYTFEIDDKSGVKEYKAVFVSNETDYADDAAWLKDITPSELTTVPSTGAEVGFKVAYFDGEEGEYRTGVLAVTVSGDHANDQTYYVKVIQGDPADNTLTVPEYLEYTYEAVNDEIIRIENSGADAEVRLQWGDDWLSIEDEDSKEVVSTGGIVTAGSDGTAKLQLSLTEYKESTESYREDVITYKATGDNYRSLVAYTTVRQTAQGAAGLTGSSTIYLTYDGISESTEIPLNLLNSSTITDVDVTCDNGSWLEATYTDYTLSYTVDTFDGGSADSRTATILVTVKNNNADESTFTITVIQGSPVEAVADVPEEIHVGYNSNTYTFEIDDKSGVTAYKAAFVSNEIDYYTDDDWLKDITPSTSTDIPDDGVAEVSFKVAEYDGEEGEYRTGVLSVTVSSDHANDQVYYVKVVQGDPAENTLTVPEYLEYTYEAVNDEIIRIENSGANAEVRLQWGDDWLSIEDEDSKEVVSTGGMVTAGSDGTVKLQLSLTEYEYSSESYREQVITYKATGDNYRSLVAYTTVRQTAQGAAGVSGATTIYLDYNEVVGEDNLKNLGFFLSNESIISGVEVTSGTSWLVVSIGEDQESVDYYVTSAYTGSLGTYRTGTFVVTVSNNNIETGTYEVTVIQGSPAAAVATVPSTLYVDYSEFTGDDDQKTFDIDLDNGVTSVTVSTLEDYDWLAAGLSSYTSGDATATIYFECDEYSGASGSTRTGTIVVTVKSDHENDQVYYIEVVQGEPTAASISAVSTYEHDYRETMTDDNYYELPYTYSGDGIETVTAEVSKQFTKNSTTYVNPWFYFFDGSSNQDKTTTVDAGDSFYYGLEEYDGSGGDYRVTTLTLTAQGDNFRPAVTYVDIIQYSQDAAGVEVSDVYVDAAAQGDSDSGILTYTPNLLSSSTISSVTSSNSWIHVTEAATDDKTFTYYIDENTTGQARTGTITLKVANSNSDESQAIITVYQSAASVTTASMPSLIYANSTDATGSFTIYPSSSASAVTAEVLGGVTWLEVETETVTKAIDYATVTYAADDYDGTTSRKATIQVTISSDDAATNDQIYYVYVEQSALTDVIFYAPDSASYGIDGTIGIGTVGTTSTIISNIDYFNYTVSGVDNSTVNVYATVDDASSSWLTMRAAQGDEKDTTKSYTGGTIYYRVEANDTSASRTGTITLTAEVDGYRSVVRYVTITQSANSFTFTIQSEQTYDALGTTDTSVYTTYEMDTIPYSFDGISGDTPSHNVYFTLEGDCDWVDMKTLNGGDKADDGSYYDGNIYYSVAENTSTSSRSTTITLKAVIEGYGTQTQYLTIYQSGAQDFITSLQSTMTISAAGNLITTKATNNDYADSTFSLSFLVSSAIAESANEDSYIQVETSGSSDWLYPASSTDCYTANSSIYTAYVAGGVGTAYFNAEANFTSEARTGQLKLTATSTANVTKIFYVDIVQPAYDLGLVYTPDFVYSSVTEGGAYGTVNMVFNTEAKTATVSIDSKTNDTSDWIKLVSEANYNAYKSAVDGESESISALSTYAAVESYTIADGKATLYYICDSPSETTSRSASIKVVTTDVTGNTSSAEYFTINQSIAPADDTTMAQYYALAADRETGGTITAADDSTPIAWNATTYTISDLIKNEDTDNCTIASVAFANYLNCSGASYSGAFTDANGLSVSVNPDQSNDSAVRTLSFTAMITFTDGSIYTTTYEYNQSCSIANDANIFVIAGFSDPDETTTTDYLNITNNNSSSLSTTTKTFMVKADNALNGEYNTLGNYLFLSNSSSPSDYSDRIAGISSATGEEIDDGNLEGYWEVVYEDSFAKASETPTYYTFKTFVRKAWIPANGSKTETAEFKITFTDGSSGSYYARVQITPN